MIEREQLENLYQQARAINRCAFEGQEFDIAYHALVTALHCARCLGSVEHLREVEELALTQLTYIDKHHPEYAHSSASAQSRHRFSVFDTAARQARARALMIGGK
jgi:hypothetical protein